MEFESEEAAKQFYDDYARRVGFIMRIDQCHRSDDQRILSRRLSCNKQGFYVKPKDAFGPARKVRTSRREGCNAMMFVKVNKSGKWVVTRFEKDHTHPLIASAPPLWSHTEVDKDRRIQELTKELEHQTRICEMYRGLLITFLKNVDDQMDTLSTKTEVVVSSIRDFETEMQKLSKHQ